MDSPELAIEVNGHILKVGEVFEGIASDDATMEFFCECGCFETVELTLAEYRANGAWVAGHRETPGKRRYSVQRLS
jgi:hypothetical protein